jgi:hypothetical protein
VHDDEEHDEEHADFDPNALREHEEFTKVGGRRAGVWGLVEGLGLGWGFAGGCRGVQRSACWPGAHTGAAGSCRDAALTSPATTTHSHHHQRTPPPTHTTTHRHHPPRQVKNIEKIELGRHEMDTWYFSPFPPEYNGCHVGGPRRRAGGLGAAACTGGWGRGLLLRAAAWRCFAAAVAPRRSSSAAGGRSGQGGSWRPTRLTHQPP